MPNEPCIHLDLEATYEVDLQRLGGVLLRGPGGRPSPLQVLGRLTYRVQRAAALADFLEREQIHDPRQLETELARHVLAHLTSVLDGDTWHVDRLHENLDVVRCELMRRVAAALAPLGLGLTGLELSAAPLTDETAAQPHAAGA